MEDLNEKDKSSVHSVALAVYIPVDQEFGKAGDEDKLNSMVSLKNDANSLTKEQEKELYHIIYKPSSKNAA